DGPTAEPPVFVWLLEDQPLHRLERHLAKHLEQRLPLLLTVPRSAEAAKIEDKFVKLRRSPRNVLLVLRRVRAGDVRHDAEIDPVVGNRLIREGIGEEP